MGKCISVLLSILMSINCSFVPVLAMEEDHPDQNTDTEEIQEEADCSEEEIADDDPDDTSEPVTEELPAEQSETPEEDPEAVYDDEEPLLYFAEDTIEMESGTELDLNAELIISGTGADTLVWTSSDSEIAEVNGGIVHAKTAGTAVITAAAEDGRNAVITVNISEPVSAGQIYFSEEEVALYLGESMTLTPDLPEEDILNLTWSSSNEEAVSVTNGTITALAEGSAEITAVSPDENTGTVSVTVLSEDEEETLFAESAGAAEEVVKPTGIYIMHRNITFAKGSSWFMDADLKPKNATGTIIWSSSNNSVFYVSRDGYCEARKVGTVTVTAKVKGTKLKDTTTIKVAVLADKVTLNETGPLRIPVGKTKKLNITTVPSNATRSALRWSSSNPDVAEVKGDVLTALNPGKTTIKSTEYGSHASLEVEVYAPVKKITLNRTSLKVGEGHSVQLNADVSPSNATNPEIVWRSSNEAVATVDESGLVTALAKGSAKITVSSVDGSGVKKTITVKVGRPVTGLSVKGFTDFSLAAGKTKKLTASVIPSKALNKTIRWSSSDPSVASVKKGEVKALKEGTAWITAESDDGEYSESVEVTVYVAVKSISLNKKSIKMGYGNTRDLKCTVTPANATDPTVIWSSSDDSIASVDENGHVTAYRSGTVTIKAAAADGSGKKAVVTVKVGRPAEQISLSREGTVYIPVKKYKTVKATVLPGNALNKTVHWYSDDPSVATVKNGTIKGISPGTATITAVCEDGGISAEITAVITK